MVLAATNGEFQMAEEKAPEVKVAKVVKARVLVDGAYGKCDDVIEIEASAVKALAGVVDTDPTAVAYAESLK